MPLRQAVLSAPCNGSHRLLQRRYGDEVVEEFLVPHPLGSSDLLICGLTEAGVEKPEVTRVEATARFPCLRDWLWIEVKEWPFANRMDDAEFEGCSGKSKSCSVPS